MESSSLRSPFVGSYAFVASSAVSVSFRSLTFTCILFKIHECKVLCNMETTFDYLWMSWRMIHDVLVNSKSWTLFLKYFPDVICPISFGPVCFSLGLGWHVIFPSDVWHHVLARNITHESINYGPCFAEPTCPKPLMSKQPQSEMPSECIACIACIACIHPCDKRRAMI